MNLETSQSVFESQPVGSAASASSHASGAVGVAAVSSSEHPCVFESRPAVSKAHAKAGVQEVLSESEYETDSEEDGTE